MSNYDLIRPIKLSRNLQANYAISFLFRLDLILDACVIHIQCDSFGILNFTSKPDLGLIVAHLWLRIHFDWLRFE